MNSFIIEKLEQHRVEYYKLWKETKLSVYSFKRLAYEKAIQQIKKLEFEIHSIDDVKGIKGIGPKILKKIKKYLKLYKENYRPTTNVFLDIWGIGEVKAKKLLDIGFRTIEDLRKNTSFLTNQQIIGLKYYEDLLKKIPRQTITVLQAIIRYILDKHYGKNTYKLTIAGSYRRGKNMSGDVDILFCSDIISFEDLIRILINYEIISDILCMKTEKFMGVGKCPRENTPFFRIDIEYVPKDKYAFGLLYFTGSKFFNQEIRQHAKKLGYLLNEHGLRYNKTGKFIKADSEEEIFDALNLVYLPPEKRN